MDTYIESIDESHYAELIGLIKEFSVFEKQSDKMTNSVTKMLKEKDFIHGFVVKDECNKIAGYVTYFVAYYTWVGKSLYMDDLYVRPGYRGKGLGTALIQKVIASAKEQDCYKVRWQVSKWNQPAIDFYNSLGAVIEGMEDNCDLFL